MEKKWLLYATMLVEDGVMERGTRGKVMIHIFLIHLQDMTPSYDIGSMILLFTVGNIVPLISSL